MKPETKKKNNHFLIGLIVFIAAIIFIAYNTKSNAEKINQKSAHLESELNDFKKKVDYRFKNYDFEFFIENAEVNGKKIFIKATNKKVLEFYDKYHQEITPFGKKLLIGEYRIIDTIK